jgi:Rad3-related DNA helicase
MDYKARLDLQLRGLLSLFPHDFVRPTQVAALEVIARMFTEGNRFSIVEIPTGAGKSALAFATARYAATLDDEDFESGAYILTPYNNLAAQLTSDFSGLGLTELKGKKHYGAKLTGTYEDARADFFGSALGVTNYAYFLKARHMPERQVLILDEGHNLERILLGMADFKITPQTCRAAGIAPPPQFRTDENARIVDWLGTLLLPALRKQVRNCREANAQREWEDLAARVVGYTDEGDRSQWIAWTDEGALSAKPLSAVVQARDLFERSRHVVIQSATIFDFTTFRRILGIPDGALTFSAPSDFPSCNRPIIYRPVGDMSRKAADETIPGLCTEIERIVADFGQCKGVVHTHSYSINERVFHHLAAKYGNRIITHDRNPHNRERAIQLHSASNSASVLVSPSLTEGIDLKDDLARFQVVCKVPYPRLDPNTRERSAKDKSWYELQTAWALVQMIGRAVRSDTDSATTFVLDSNFERFVSRNERILPAWWRGAIQFLARAS